MRLFDVPEVKGLRPYEVRALVRNALSKPLEIREATLMEFIETIYGNSKESTALVHQLLNVALHLQKTHTDGPKGKHANDSSGH